MAPKPKSLREIRQEVAARRRAIAPVMAGSAFEQLEKKNERFVHGRAVTRRAPDELPRRVPTKVTKRQPKKTTKSRIQSKSAVSKPAEMLKKPEVESWRSAGGDSMWHSDQGVSTSVPTRRVTIARVSKWMLELFRTSVRDAIERYGELQKFEEEEVQDGAEACVDVVAVFRSELAAEVVKDGLDGQIVGDRKLQLRYA